MLHVYIETKEDEQVKQIITWPSGLVTDGLYSLAWWATTWENVPTDIYADRKFKSTRASA